MQNIKSMTAFARCPDNSELGNLTWEIRSVNHRYLEASFRTPDIFRKLEPNLRQLLNKYITRGKVECILQFQPGTATITELNLNSSVLTQLAEAINKLNKYFPENLAKVSPLQLLGWNNVLQNTNHDSIALEEKITALFIKAVTELVTVRQKEGAALQQLLVQKLQNILTEVSKIQKMLPLIIENHRTKILNYFKEVSVNLNPERLEQEMLLFVQKIDVTEELDRISVHAEEVKKAFATSGTIGKRLDFIMQELTREANTLASKSPVNEVTYGAIELKVLIEQMREQVQNIE